jgi:hypothetical protein
MLKDDTTDLKQSDNHWQDDVLIENEDAMLSVQSAARQAGVSRTTVVGWIRNGFIDAITSRDGWLVRAGDIERARQNADETRRGLSHSSKDRETSSGNTQGLARVQDDASRQARTLEEGDLAPLSEFLREQAGIVQEQAETIGWLQAELRLARERLESLEQSELDHSVVNKTEVQDTTRGAQSKYYAEKHDSKLDLTAYYNVIEEDPFSEEAAQARQMIEKTERKIQGMWSEQEERRARHIQARVTTNEVSWFKRLTSPLMRRET